MNTSSQSVSRVFDATVETFEQDVILRSNDVPVLVDFWATWCGPCKSLGPILEKLAEEYHGAFVLAKVDVDREQELGAYFQIRSVPTVMLLKGGRVVAGFPGALPEGQVRRFLEQHGVVPGEPDAAAESDGQQPADPAADVEHLREAVTAEPDRPEHKRDLGVALAATGEHAEARALLEALPANLAVDNTVVRAFSRIRLLEAAEQAPPKDALEASLAADPDDAESRYLLGVRQVLNAESAAGLETLLELLRRHRGYRDGLPRQALVDAFNVTEDEALVRACRRRMTALLF